MMRAIVVVVVGVAACGGAKPKPPELDALQMLRHSPAGQQSEKAAPELVSGDTMRMGIDTWNLYNALGWFKFQRTNRDTTEAVYTIDDRPQLAAPVEHRNVPQPVFEELPAF